MNQQPDQDTRDRSGNRPSFPNRIDPGWATVIASTLALVGTLAAIWFRQQPPAPLPPPAAATVEVVVIDRVTATAAPPDPTATPPAPTAAEPLPTAAEPLPTDIPATATDIPATPTDKPPTPTRKPPTPPATSTAVVIPRATVTTILDVAPEKRAGTQETAESLLDATKSLPLIIRDSFDVNDYAWREFDDKYDTGVECGAEIRGGMYHIYSTSPTTARGPVWCMPTAPRKTGDFYLAFDAQLAQNQRADIMLYYRYEDDDNFYYLMVNPQTQLMTFGVALGGEYMTIIDRAFVPEIKRTGANRLAVIALGDQHVIYVNGSLFAHIDHKTNLDKGGIRLGLQVYGAEQTEELTIDNLELRGDL